MKTMFTGFAGAIVIATLTYFGLNALGYSSADVSASQSVRVGNAGPDGD